MRQAIPVEWPFKHIYRDDLAKQGAFEGPKGCCVIGASSLLSRKAQIRGTTIQQYNTSVILLLVDARSVFELLANGYRFAHMPSAGNLNVFNVAKASRRKNASHSQQLKVGGEACRRILITSKLQKCHHHTARRSSKPASWLRLMAVAVQLNA